MYCGWYSLKISSIRVALEISAIIVSASMSRQRSCNSRRISCNGVSLPIEPAAPVIITRFPSRWEATLWISISIGSRCRRSSIWISFNWVRFKVCPLHSLKGGAVISLMLCARRRSAISDFFSSSILAGEIIIVCTSRSFNTSIRDSSFGNTFTPIITLLISSGSSAMKPRRR